MTDKTVRPIKKNPSLLTPFQAFSLSASVVCSAMPSAKWRDALIFSGICVLFAFLGIFIGKSRSICVKRPNTAVFLSITGVYVSFEIILRSSEWLEPLYPYPPRAVGALLLSLVAIFAVSRGIKSVGRFVSLLALPAVLSFFIIASGDAGSEAVYTSGFSGALCGATVSELVGRTALGGDRDISSSRKAETSAGYPRIARALPAFIGITIGALISFAAPLSSPPELISAITLQLIRLAASAALLIIPAQLVMSEKKAHKIAALTACAVALVIKLI